MSTRVQSGYVLVQENFRGLGSTTWGGQIVSYVTRVFTPV